MRSHSRLFDAIIIFSILTVLYSVFYSGTFLTDDEHILSSRALSFAFEGHFNNDRVLGNSRVFEYSVVPKTWANQALNIEPAQAMAASSLAVLSTYLGLGRIQLMFLLNIWVTAATAVMVYLSAAKMGYSRGVSFLVTTLFGLGTIAMPYSRTFFRDPLAMFFLAAAWYFAILIRQTNLEKRSDNLRLAALWVTFLGLFAAGVLSKNSVILALPIMLLEIAVDQKRTVKPSIKKWLIPLFLFAGLILCWIFIVPAIPVLTRFSPNYYFSVLQKFFTAPGNDLVLALIGPFISPGKSIFIFSPVLLLSLWSLIFHFRSSWSAWLYLLLLVISQALFYGSEWAGHVNWGLRFVLPAIPLLVLASAPAINDIWKKRIGAVVLFCFLFLSFMIQVLGSVVPVRQFYLDSFYTSTPVTEYATIWNRNNSILPWSLKWIGAGKPLDMAVYRNPSGLWIIIPSIIIIVGSIIISLKSKKRAYLTISALILALVMDIGLVSFYRYDPAYALSRSDFRQSQDYLISHHQSGDRVLVKSYSENIWNYWMNWGEKSIHWTALPFTTPSPSQVSAATAAENPALALDKITLWIFQNRLPPNGRVWLIEDETSISVEYDFEAQWLKTHSKDSHCLRFTDQQSSTRVCLFD